MKKQRKRKCLCCKELFRPDPRNLRHQRYCSTERCRIASKAASQHRWLNKKENQHYFRGSAHVQRVQAWRRQHPGYWRRNSTQTDSALQDDSLAQPIEKHGETDILAHTPLQADLFVQPAVLIGLIANLTGTTLQDEIVDTSQRLLRLGRQILARNPQGADHDRQIPVVPGASSSAT